MRRRTVAAFVVLFVTLIGVIISYFYPEAFEFLLALMVPIAIVFKTALLSFFTVSKLKIVAFFKSLTLLQTAILLIKRWFLDNIFAKWLHENIVRHLIEPLKSMVKYYKSLNLRRKVKNFLLPFLSVAFILWLIYTSGYLDKVLLFTELKVFIIGFTKSTLLLLSKIFSFILDSWITPILEVFALSYLLNSLEEWLGSEHMIIKAFNWIGVKIHRAVEFFSDINKKYFAPFLLRKVSKKSRQFGTMLERYIDRKKSEYEYEQFERLENKILKGHIDAYFHFKGLEKIRDKKELYRLINKKTKDALNIVAFVSRNKYGELVPESVEDSYYHDIFILEGVATSHKEGIKSYKKEGLDSSDFWILNTSNYPVILLQSDKFEEQIIEPKSVTFIKTKSKIDYNKDRICFEFRHKRECAIVLNEGVK